MTTSHILLNTRVSPLQRPIIELLRWKEADDICCSIHPGFRAKPTRQALALMMNQLKIETWWEIPVRPAVLAGASELLAQYKTIRTAWLIQV